MNFNSELKLVNEQALETKEIKNIIVSYSSDSIHLYKNNSEELLLKEYMNYDPENAELADITIKDNSLIIKSGERNLRLFNFTGLNRRIEIYLPLNYEYDFEINSSSGSIKSSEVFKFTNFKAHSSSGSIKLKDIYADDINISSNSGSINMENSNASKLSFKSSSGSIKLSNVKGESTFLSNSGLIEVEKIEGKINASASSGSIKMTIKKLNGDIKATTSSGSINITLPEDSSFEFKAKVNSGSIKTYFETKSLNSNTSSYGRIGKEVSVNIGDNPNLRIDLNASSGSIKLNSL